VLNIEQIKALSPADRAKLQRLLSDMELTEWQRRQRGLRERLRERNLRGEPVEFAGYHDVLKAARIRYRKDAKHRPAGKALAEKPDELARRAQLEREQKDKLAAMQREFQALRQPVTKEDLFTEAPSATERRTAAPKIAAQEQPENIADVSVYDSPMTLESINERERIFREHHVIGGGWGT
jgi:hypothetical protein